MNPIATSALNTVMMVSFAIPGGQPVGVAACIGLFFAEILGSKNADSGGAPVTQKELQDAVHELAGANWLLEVDKIASNVSSLADGFSKKWTALTVLTFDPQGWAILAPDTDTDFVTHTDDYFDLENNPTGVPAQLTAHLDFLEADHSMLDSALTALQLREHKTKTTVVYCLVGSLLVAYYKAAVIWQWGKQLLKIRQYKHYNDDLTLWMKSNPGQQPPTTLAQKYPGLDPKKVPSQWSDWLKEPDNPVPQLKDQVTRLLGYTVNLPGQNGAADTPGLCAVMRQHWDAFDVQVASWDVDSSQGMTVAVLGLAGSKGADRAGYWVPYMDQYGMGKLVEDDILAFEETVDAWRAGVATVQFQEYLVKAGDTFDSIAKHFNMSAQDLLDTNTDQCDDMGSLAADMVLRVFDAAAVPYIKTLLAAQKPSV